MLGFIWVPILLIATSGFILFLLQIYRRRPWLGNYIKYRLRHRPPQPMSGKPVHILFLFVDHFEPKENCQDEEIQRARMRNWVERYPPLARQFRDADGKFPQHTWFYQVEDWEHSHLDTDYLRQLAGLSYDGFGEVELHIHHNQQEKNYFPNVTTGERLHALIEEMKEFFAQTGALVTAEKSPIHTYGFIHGMFALDNAHDGLHCGVNNEFQILRATNCYADFTMPAGVYVAQSKRINSIYYVVDDPHEPRSHDDGIDVAVGHPPVGDLLCLQGPLWVNFFKKPKWWKLSVENANIDDTMPPNPQRIDRWIRANIHVKGQPNWVFVKVHTHGSRENSFAVYFEEPAIQMFRYLTERYNDGKQYVLHFVTAREAYNIVKAAEAGKTGNPHEYRDFMVKPYANTKIKSNCLYQLQTWTPKRFAFRVLKFSENARFEFKETLIARISADTLEQFEFQHDGEDQKALLRLQGEGQCTLNLRNGSLKEAFQDGRRITPEDSSSLSFRLPDRFTLLELILH